MFFIHHFSKTTTWTRPVTRPAPPSPPPPVAHVPERQHKSTHNYLRILGTAGMVGTLYVAISCTIYFPFFVLCVRALHVLCTSIDDRVILRELRMNTSGTPETLGLCCRHVSHCLHTPVLDYWCNGLSVRRGALRESSANAVRVRTTVALYTRYAFTHARFPFPLSRPFHVCGLAFRTRSLDYCKQRYIAPASGQRESATIAADAADDEDPPLPKGTHIGSEASFPRRAWQHHSLVEYLVPPVLAFSPPPSPSLARSVPCQSQQHQKTFRQRWTPMKTLLLLLILSKLLMVVVAALKVVQAMTTSRSPCPLVGTKNARFFCVCLLSVSFAVIPMASPC